MAVNVSLQVTLSHTLHTYIIRELKTPRGHMHGDHLSGKPGNVRQFDSCQGMSGKKSCQEKFP